MKMIHLSDLHLGKWVNQFSMLDDQRYILERIVEVIDREKPDAVLIAGDVYDKTVPPAEAVTLLDDFLVKLAERSLPVLIISGNHDSPERLAFANRLMRQRRVFISPVYNGAVGPVTLEDALGPVDFYLLPFLKPAHVRRFFPEEETESCTDALACAIRHMPIDPARRNVLVTHQFVTGSERCESEEISVGGSDNVDASVFAPFDYVALGHLHGPQNVGENRIRYCGTPLKYSFSESAHQKSVSVVELKEKGDLSVRAVPLTPRRDMAEIKGAYQELTLKSYYEGTSYQEDYLHITLTDEEDIPEAVSKLRAIYHNLMNLDYDNTRTRHQATVSGAVDVETKTPLELFADFYARQNGSAMTPEQIAFMGGMIEKVWGDAQ